VSVDEALSWLRPWLWVPGHHAHDWSEGWKPKSAEAAETDWEDRGEWEDSDGDQKNPGSAEPGEWIRDQVAANELNDLQVQRVRARLVVRAKEEFGLDLDHGQSPTFFRRQLVKILEELVEEEKGRRGSGVGH